MTKLLRRIERLEGKKGTVSAGPSVIFICDAVTGEPGTALMIGSKTLTREAGETAEAFTARAEAWAIVKGAGDVV